MRAEDEDKLNHELNVLLSNHLMAFYLIMNVQFIGIDIAPHEKKEREEALVK